MSQDKLTEAQKLAVELEDKSKSIPSLPTLEDLEKRVELLEAALRKSMLIRFK